MANQHTKTRVTEPDPNHTHVLPGPSNEELIAKQEAAERERAEKGYPRVEFGTDAHDKKTDGFGDLDFDPLGLSDPLLALKNAYEKPGMSLKLLSPEVMNRHGKRGYQVVRDESGDPVMCGKMVLGEIPKRAADARKRAVMEKTNDELRGIQDAQREAVDKLKSDAKGLGLEVLEPNERVQNVGDGNVYDMGFSVQRGEDSSR